MDQTLINDVARAVHLLGMALGFGVAFIADILDLNARDGKIRQKLSSVKHRIMQVSLEF